MWFAPHPPRQKQHSFPVVILCRRLHQDLLPTIVYDSTTLIHYSSNCSIFALVGFATWPWETLFNFCIFSSRVVCDSLPLHLSNQFIYGPMLLTISQLLLHRLILNSKSTFCQNFLPRAEPLPSQFHSSCHSLVQLRIEADSKVNTCEPISLKII